jgi:phage terminase large subunit GpA-like protein
VLLTPTLKPLAPFAHLSGRTVTTRPSRALRRRMRTPETLTISQWAEKHRRVTEIDAKPGKWRPELVPHAAPIMDDIGKPWVRQVWICLPERGAKTQILLNTVCWGIDQGAQAGNIFWLMPTEADARKAMGERVIPVFRANDDNNRPGRIARYLSHAADDTSRGAIRFNHGIRLFPAWANSPGSMASYFGRINIADECDKFPERTSEGTDPITLFLKRARDDRHRSKYVFASTPAGRFIAKGTANCQQVKTWALRCPDCGEIVTPGEEHLIIPEGTTIDDCAHAELHVSCPACGSLWDEEARAVAYHGGRPLILKGADTPRPDSIGWQIPAWIFPNIPLAEIAAALLRARSGDLAAKTAWANGYRVEDYAAEVTSDRSKEHLLAYRSELPRGLAPSKTARIALIADTQQDHFYYQLWCYGYQPKIAMHMAQHGIVQTFADLEHFLGEYLDSVDGHKIPVAIGLIDSGGTKRGWQKHSRTVEVYQWTAANRKMVPIKGVFGSNGTPITYKTIEVWPGTTKKIPGGLVRANLQVDLFKDELARLLAIHPDDPGALSFHSEIDVNFSGHFCAEVKDENGDWQHDKKRGRNDYWDCAVYAVALREILKTRIGKEPQPEAAKKKTFTQSKGATLE